MDRKTRSTVWLEYLEQQTCQTGCRHVGHPSRLCPHVPPPLTFLPLIYTAAPIGSIRHPASLSSHPHSTHIQYGLALPARTTACPSNNFKVVTSPGNCHGSVITTGGAPPAGLFQWLRIGTIVPPCVRRSRPSGRSPCFGCFLAAQLRLLTMTDFRLPQVTTRGPLAGCDAL
ncbi:hypothetical protein C8Q80DRAFT_194229 [Daedaleopsis nitida]|nr:hypothetical protein C8Q80DRAFT_194229 [Daedaleopsis nitida]